MQMVNIGTNMCISSDEVESIMDPKIIEKETACLTQQEGRRRCLLYLQKEETHTLPCSR